MLRDLGFRDLKENQMEKKMGKEMDNGLISIHRICKTGV